MKTTTKVIKAIASRGYILESEINLLKNRLNRGDSQVWDIFESFSGMISQEQTEKGLAWIMNQWKTPAGKERKHNPLGYWEQRIMQNFSHFEFIDFVDCGNSFVTWYMPIYKVVDASGDSFSYYYKNGEMIIY